MNRAKLSTFLVFLLPLSAILWAGTAFALAEGKNEPTEVSLQDSPRGHGHTSEASIYDYGHSNQWEFDEARDFFFISGTLRDVQDPGVSTGGSSLMPRTLFPGFQVLSKWNFSPGGKFAFYTTYGLSGVYLSLKNGQGSLLDPSNDPGRSLIGLSPSFGISLSFEPFSWVRLLGGGRATALFYRQSGDRSSSEAQGLEVALEPSVSLLFPRVGIPRLVGWAEAAYTMPELRKSDGLQRSLLRTTMAYSVGLGMRF